MLRHDQQGANMSDAALVSEIIGVVYDSILKPQEWQRALKKVCEALHSPAASVHVMNPIAQRTVLYADYGSDPTYIALANSKYNAMNPVAAAVLLGELDQPMGLFDLIDEAELVETRWYKEWCVPQRYHDMMGAIIAKRPSEIGAVSAVRLVDQPLFRERSRVFCVDCAARATRRYDFRNA
jgi:hypothetical protein